MPRRFGHIEGFPPTTEFANRQKLHDAHVHRPTQAGISGGRHEGADSIVVSGGYEDDDDHGSYIIYTGAGGNDSNTKRQIADQDIHYFSNAALIKSQLEGYPVRVTRGFGGDPKYSPKTGYRYDGLFNVVDHWTKTGNRGFQIVQFRLEQIEDFPQSPRLLVDERREGPVELRSTVVQRQVRSSAIIGRVKSLYQHQCQVCAIVIKVEGGPYAEGAHIRGLGRPHLGPDVVSNVLCLCPNDHVRFDYGAIHLSDELDVINTQTGRILGRLLVRPAHRIDMSHVAYHRSLWKS
jgi:putative restriction endonuclease